ncbi:MAG: EAL domain-containing protein [Gammaproteobacteria bacterium]|nr:EAL domain-containing protein [Gammaproteobacteria bacterium]
MTLRIKLNLILVSLLIVTNGMVAYLLIEKEKNLLSESISEQAGAIAALISQDAVKLIILDDPDAATDITSKLKQLKNLSQVTFFNTQGKAIFTLKNAINTTEQDFIYKVLPLSYNGMVLGKITLSFSKNLYHSATETLTDFLIQILLFGLLLGGVFAIFIDQFFSRRLTRLNNALEQTAKNQDYTIRLPENSQDEIGRAYHHFNALVTKTDSITKKLIKQASHDELTGLYNRLFFTEKLTEIINQAKPEQTHAICYLDLDKFKIINDTFGHHTGDQLLTELAHQLNDFSQAIPNSYFCRIGGDEFVLLVRNTNIEALTSHLDMLQQIVRKFYLDYQNQRLTVGLSVGSILFKEHSKDINALVSAADIACYQAKHKGGNSSLIFWVDSPELQSEREIVNWVQRIKTAMETHALKVYLQQIVCRDNTPECPPAYEALVRLIEGDKVISPFEFIPTLERFKMMTELDFYMIQAVADQLKNNQAFLPYVTHIAINLSGATLTSDNAAHRIISIIEAANLPFDKLCFEVTETTAVSNLDAAKAFIMCLANKGCKFSLDDFGTGMASFEYLYALPLNYLKIDGSFIKDIPNDPIKYEMVKAMQKIALLMNLETVAEFVENEEIIEKLELIGVHYHQGYYYSAPKPIEYFIQQTLEQPL